MLIIRSDTSSEFGYFGSPKYACKNGGNYVWKSHTTGFKRNIEWMWPFSSELKVNLYQIELIVMLGRVLLQFISEFKEIEFAT